MYVESLNELSQDSLVDANVAEPRPTFGPNVKGLTRVRLQFVLCLNFVDRHSLQQRVRERDDRKGVEKREGTDT